MVTKNKSGSCYLFSRWTKPLSFGDCVGDELPLGWEEAFDAQVGVYYIDHNTSKCSNYGIVLPHLEGYLVASYWDAFKVDSLPCFANPMK